MMFGLGEDFDYFHCPQCNSLQIAAIPENLGKYYEGGYYSYTADHSPLKRLSIQMAIWRDSYVIYGGHPLGKIISWFVPAREEITFISYLEGIDRHSKILDMGSGVGFYLHRLDDLGFTDLRGIDPFLKEETIRSGRITIYKKFLEEFEEKDFDLITLHHVFEHLPNPGETLNAIYSKLRPNGYCVIRVPVIPNVAWDEYRQHWFQLDAPRHIFIPSTDTMTYLTRQTWFEIVGTIYDSTPKQFYISEQYREGIPMSKQTHRIAHKKMAEYEKRTTIANKMGKGDQAIFILRKPAR